MPVTGKVSSAPVSAPAPDASQSYSYSNLEGKDAARNALAEEVALAIAYNGISQAVMLVSPTDLEDFIVGFSLGSGIIASPDEIYDFKLSGCGLAMQAEVEIASRAFWELKQQRRQLAGTSGCGLCGVEAVEQAPAGTRRLSGWKVCANASANSSPSAVIAVRYTRRCSWTASQLLMGREDIGRHNALDKLIGALVRQGISTVGGVAIVTSRCSLELIQKVSWSACLRPPDLPCNGLAVTTSI